MVKKKQLQIDSGILQFAPKGAFYESADEQTKKITEMWKNLFEFDRVLFALITLLNGTGFSKGAMSHMLLSNPQSGSGKELIPQGLSFDYETNVIKYNLFKERTPRALKNLLMLTGRDGFKRVNNSKTRKLIFDYIFDRDLSEVESLFLNYKNKIKILLRHAFGKQDLYNILHGNIQLFAKKAGEKYKQFYPVVLYTFNVDVSDVMKGKAHVRFHRIEKYFKLRNAAQKGNIIAFQKLMTDMPYRTVLGFRNTYKLKIELKEVVEDSKMSSREALQKQSAAKRVGATVKVDYKKQELYDLLKLFYHKVSTNDKKDLKRISDIIDEKTNELNKMDIGPCCIILDTSRSMEGSQERPLHPFLTSLCVFFSIDNIQDVIYVGGNVNYFDLTGQGDEAPILMPSGCTDIWRALVKAVKAGHKNIIVISDGYENSIKGMFEHTYNYFKKSGYEFNLVHINPVFAADAKTGSSRNLVSDIKALPVSDYKYLETELLFTQMLTNREMVKKMLAAKYQRLLERK
jgi:hypothetical protein